MDAADRGSRIVVLSPWAQTHAHLAHPHLVALVQSIVAQDEHEDGEAAIAWTISNRYYTGEVHFEVLACQLFHTRAGAGIGAATQLSSRRVKGVPSRDRPPDDDESEDGREGDEEEEEQKEEREDDAALQARVRDVFEALDRPAGGAARVRAAPGAIDDEAVRHIATHLDGVDAVVLVVDRSQPYSEHEKLLAALEQSDLGLSGFDLAVSLVVALPPPLRPLEPASSLDDYGPGPSTRASAGPAEQVLDLYTGHGWEFVDLLDDDDNDGLLSALSGSGSDAEPGAIEEEEEEAGTAEEKGLERVREALMTHTWPNLVRKDGDEARAARSARLAQVRSEAGQQARPPAPIGANGFSDWPGGDGLDEDGDEDEFQDDPLDVFDLARLPGQGDAGASAEPTAQDEALARAFLDRINDAQRAGLFAQPPPPPSSAAAAATVGSGGGQHRDVHQELEDFLANEDPAWPGLASAQSTTTTTAASTSTATATTTATASSTAEAWPKSGAAEQRGTDAFDDDFSDFASGQAQHEGEDGQLYSSHGQASSAMSTAPGGPGIEFEATLSAVQAQAERVRSIADPEKRREKAAEVALAFAQMVLGGAPSSPSSSPLED